MSPHFGNGPGVNCRFGPKREPPFEIAAGVTEIIECELDVFQPGTFSAQIHVFIDDGGLHESILTVAGDAQARPSAQ
jgi:hypothetical protein